jgi:hypothetical protein
MCKIGIGRIVQLLWQPYGCRWLASRGSQRKTASDGGMAARQRGGSAGAAARPLRWQRQRSGSSGSSGSAAAAERWQRGCGVAAALAGSLAAAGE